jgi:hypothetical protein
MSRGLILLALVLLLVFPAWAEPGDDGPPIAITSPDKGTTYALSNVKNHALYWNKSQQMLIARITFTDEDTAMGTPVDDVHEFRLPGISFDEAKGIFTATTAKGEVIPIAHFKKVLFIKSIETMPNAAVRVLHPNGNITVILEAISPNDPALHQGPGNTDPDATHQVDINSILH